MMQVSKRCCGQCLFTPKKIVSDARKKDILKTCEQDDTHFICHKATIKKQNVVCRGFFENQSTNALRVAERLGLIEFVEVE
ncbi:hypothetical protein Ares1_0087 [Vibrio phage Ares1]|nr:hypothetical protein Ares1_0087 [Vibrio phage Ares1]